MPKKIEIFKDIIWNFLKKYRKYALLFCDFLIWNISFYLSFAINRNEVFLVGTYVTFFRYLIITNICFMTVFLMFKLYDKIWRYADIEDFFYAGVATCCANFLFFGVTLLLNMNLGLRMYVLFLLISAFAIFMLRILYRINKVLENVSVEEKGNRKRLLIIGAGESTASVLREISKYQANEYDPICIVDDDESKIGRKMMGVKIEGAINKIAEICSAYEIEVILFSINHITNERRREILDICAKTALDVRIVPNFYEAAMANVPITSTIRQVKVEDLLGRNPVIFDKKKYGNYLIDKTILITGGGGSIGSELCRQIATLTPKKLIILDIYENTAYEIEQELKMRYGEKLNVVVKIASICDKSEISRIFKNEEVDVVFHAAAHKHVPLMEGSPNEAIKNNVFGTLTLSQCADKYKIKKFVQISTDKAVNPTNIMGTTKRICEMIVQETDKISKTEFVAVRFGNVLGSNGSVIPLFEEQIKKMGPVTVTHPDIIRYFMTIPEAVSLVLTAGGLAEGGEIFVLDMGAPVKIKDLAENLIRLSGFIPHEEIEIEYTGLRPGEKLYEELLMSEEGMKNTKNEKIFIGKPITINSEEFSKDLENLRFICESDDILEIKNLLKKIVPTFKTI